MEDNPSRGDGRPAADEPELVWYAGYGSNLLADRFAAYMVGAPPPNSPDGIAESGARDSSAPRAEWCGEIDVPIVFAGESSKWGGGGVAFIDQAARGEPAFVRAYLVTVEQLEDLHRQENRSPVVHAVDTAALVRDGYVRLHEGFYSDLVVAATHPDDGRPIVVVAGPTMPKLRAPDISYLRTMASGLSTDFDLSQTDIAEYLASRPGASGELSAQWIHDALWSS